LGAIATLGIFAGTYAKYVSVLPLTSNGDDLSARVAIWNVGRNAEYNVELFSKWYYGNSGDESGNYANSGHNNGVTEETVDTTVFTNNGDNLVAPGTHGFKMFRITNATGGGGSRLKAAKIPTTEVTYKLTVGDITPSAIITDEVETDVFKGQLWFAVLTNFGENGDESPMVNWSDNTYLLGGTVDYISIPWKNVDAALAGMYTDGDNATNLGNVKEDKDIVVLWKWDFEKGENSDEISANDAKDNSLGKATALPTISINFGTIRAEQVD
ncbi:MAG: hypothetical protein LBS33_02910, partial [Streptococcaceae bacterium]|nr:hypothetical protein [Streptococcaceae bacterium]